MKLIIFGNSGSGKSTLAKRLINQPPATPADPIAYLSLDHIAWDPDVQRKPLEASIALLQTFVKTERQWIIEGCYGDLVAAALPHCDELWFLNPGVDVCLAHCQQRPWEPDKFASPEEQQAALNHLIEWVRTYESRTDEFGLQRHRQVFDGFTGRKQEFNHVAEYDKAIPLYSGG